MEQDSFLGKIMGVCFLNKARTDISGVKLVVAFGIIYFIIWGIIFLFFGLPK